MSVFEIASECRKLRDEIVFYRYQQKSVLADFPNEVKQFYNNATLKIKKLSYTSLNQLKQESLELIQKDIGPDRMNSIKLNSIVKFINSYRDDLDVSITDSNKGDNSEESDEHTPISTESSNESRIPLHDNFTESESDRLAGFCQEACRALLRNATTKVTSISSSLTNENSELNTIVKAKNQALSSTIMNAVYSYGETFGEKLAIKYNKSVDDFLYNYTASAISEESITTTSLGASSTTSNKVKSIVKKSNTINIPAVIPKVYIPRVRDERGHFGSYNDSNGKRVSSSSAAMATAVARGTKRTLSSSSKSTEDDMYIYGDVLDDTASDKVLSTNTSSARPSWSHPLPTKVLLSSLSSSSSTAAPSHPSSLQQRPLQRISQPQPNYMQHLQHPPQDSQGSVVKRPYIKSDYTSSSSSLSLPKTSALTATISTISNEGFVALPSKQNVQQSTSLSSSSSGMSRYLSSDQNPFQKFDLKYTGGSSSSNSNTLPLSTTNNNNSSTHISSTAIPHIIASSSITMSSNNTSSTSTTTTTSSAAFPRKMLNSYVPLSSMTSGLSQLRQVNINNNNNNNNNTVGSAQNQNRGTREDSEVVSSHYTSTTTANVTRTVVTDNYNSNIYDLNTHYSSLSSSSTPLQHQQLFPDRIINQQQYLQPNQQPVIQQQYLQPVHNHHHNNTQQHSQHGQLTLQHRQPVLPPSSSITSAVATLAQQTTTIQQQQPFFRMNQPTNQQQQTFQSMAAMASSNQQQQHQSQQSQQPVPVTLPVGVRLISQGSYRTEVSVCGRQVVVGTFGTSALAGRAHDLALIRALGPKAACESEKGLNMPIESYSTVSLKQFAIYDEILKRQLFGTSWTGTKNCDFSFLVLRK